MANFVLAVAIIVGGWWLLRAFANSQPARIRSLSRKVAGWGIIALAGFLALRGGMNVAIPLFMLGLGLIGQAAVFPNGFPWSRKSPGQKSRVATSVLAMELDHDTGGMEGEILMGPLKGRRLSSLAPEELKVIHAMAAGAPDQSRPLFEAWLDRSRSGWRDSWGGKSDQGAPGRSGGAMSRDEAYAVLGLQSGAGTEDVRAAHRRLMKEFHPDKGGSDYLAAKINQAKDILLQD